MPYLTETEHQKLMLDLIKAEEINAELLEALKSQLESCSATGCGVCNKARLAIAKAEGR